MSIAINTKPIPINKRVCTDCQNSLICKYRDAMDSLRQKLISMTTSEDKEIAPELDLGSCFDLFLGCNYYRSNVNVQKVPEFDPYQFRDYKCNDGPHCGNDRTKPVDMT